MVLSSSLPVLLLFLRMITLIFLLISIVVLTTSTATLVLNLDVIKLRFRDIHAYRYMLATMVIGILYTLAQIGLTIYHVVMGVRLVSSDGIYLFDFYGDKVMSYVLGTGSAAAFGASVDLKEALSGYGSSTDKFFNKGNAAASLLLFAFFFTAVSSVLSSLALSKRTPS